MLHVAHPVPATWRGGTIQAIVARLQLRERVVRLYQRLTDGPGIKAAIRATLGARWVGIVEKARSLTQTPSALDRVSEQVVAFHVVGIPAHELRQIPAALDGMIDELTIREAVREADVLHSIEVGVMLEAKGNEAEALLLCRADRQLTRGDAERLLEATESEIAADRDTCAKLRRFLAQERAAAQGMTVIRGGRR
jgi:hypothetical protein